MSIFAAVDNVDMSLQWDDDARSDEEEAECAMRLIADGVPLQLLVDIALPMTLIRELFTDSERAVPS
jgi:hypothetical protein